MTSPINEIIEPTILPKGRVEYWAARVKQASTRLPIIRRFNGSFANESGNKLIAFPEPRSLLKKEIKKSKLLGETADGMSIYLFDYHLNSSVMKEIGRLREVAFRAVGEGTQRARDVDHFDKYYRHIVLWNEQELEIVGAYRIGEAGKIVAEKGVSGLYTSRLFDYQPRFDEVFPSAIELGRSFIQPKYWGKRSLDYLWMGIGAYLSANPEVRYLFGAVSISNDIPEKAKSHIVRFYQHCFQRPDHKLWAVANMPYEASGCKSSRYDGLEYKEGLKELKAELKKKDVTLPTLYKHYGGFAKAEGTHFIDFNVDPEFSYTVDALTLVDLNFIKSKKYQRYIQPHLSEMVETEQMG
jgi:hypothetical protein